MSDLLTAAKNGYFNQVITLLSTKSCDVDAPDKDKATPLYWSASRGHAKICEVLLQAGCDVNACVKWGSTALHAAADRGHADCLTVLLDRGADLHLQNERGDTALHLAAYRGYRDLVQLLVTTGRADPFIKNAQSKTPLQEAQSQQHTAAARVLQEYMESLGCRPFKSLPVSEGSSRQTPPQEQPSSSPPAKSWPPYQSFPKFPEPVPPTELSRPHTHPLLVNDLSQNAGGVGDATRPSKTGAGRGAGSASLTGLPGFGAGTGERLQPVHGHSDPQENVDECLGWNKAPMAGEPRREHQRFVHGVGDDQRYHNPYPSDGVRLNQLSRPTAGGNHAADTGADTAPRRSLALSSPSSPATTRRHQNGQDNVNGVGRMDLYPSHMAPSRHHPQSFVKHEDLTLFAESLQLEVVKLRESLSSKERQMSDLEHALSSLRAQNSQLQQLVADKQKEFLETLASKDSEMAELKRKFHDAERRNQCLQQAVVENQTNSSQVYAFGESQVWELTAKISDLERRNSSIQELFLSQQDTMKGFLASKDLEIAALKDKLAGLAQRRASSPVASSQHPVSSPGPPLTAHLHSGAGTEPANPAPGTSGLSSTSAVSPLRAQSHTHPSLQESVSQSLVSTPLASEAWQTTPDRPISSISPRTLPTGSPPAVTLPQPGTGRVTDGLPQCQLRAAVSGLFQDTADPGKLDADGREWTAGKEFQLLDPRPVNCEADGQRRGACSLVFRIQHRGRKYMLKMLTNLINLSYEAHSQGRSLDAHLLPCFGAEFHAPLLLHHHPNIVRVRHHYQGDTSHFERYLHLLVPPTLDVPVEMARRTTFLVLEQYPLTLQTFVDDVWKKKQQVHQPRPGDEPQPPRSFSGVPRETVQQFLLQLVYQLLSAVEFLQRHEVVHRDIKADNVFLDWRLRPVLGDFGLARTLRGHGGRALAPFTDRSQAMAGNSHAWAPELCRWSRADPSTLPQPLTVKDIYSKADGFAVARMFYHFFHRHNSGRQKTDANKDDNGDDDNTSNSSRDRREEEEGRFPTSTLQHPHYADSAVPHLQPPVCAGLAHVLRSLVLDDPSRRPSARQALCRVGVLLLKPDVTLTSEEEAEEFCGSRLLALSAIPPTAVRSSPPPEAETLSVAQSVTANQNHCQADFLLSFSGKDFWEAYTEMKKLGF